jgi:hypothetical protein
VQQPAQIQTSLIYVPEVVQLLIIMGFSSDIMHDFVEKEIKAIYSSYDGWKITQKNLNDTYDTIVTLERRIGGHRDYIRILATFSKEVSPSLFDELKKPEQSNDGTVARHAFAVLVPVNADTSSVPAGIQVHIMRSFAYEGKELTWVKKPVRKAEAPKVAA